MNATLPAPRKPRCNGIVTLSARIWGDHLLGAKRQGWAPAARPGMATSVPGEAMEPAPDQPLRLSMEERRALSLSATGLATTDVAAAMGATPDDVRRWLASAIVKLGTHSKLEAVIIALQQGLIQPGNN